MVSPTPSFWTTTSPVPQGLIDAVSAGDCVLYTGAGLGARSGLPTYRDLLSGLITWSQEKKLISEAAASTYRKGIEHGDLASAADGFVTDTLKQSETLYDQVRAIFARPFALSDAHRLISKIPFCAALTTNYDRLLEETFVSRTARVLTPSDADSLVETLYRKEFFILKLHGALDRNEGLLISPAQFEDAVRENLPFSKFMETIFFSKTLLFMGASLDGIETFLQAISLRRQAHERAHFALVELDGDGWLSKAHWLERRFGIQVLPYRAATAKHPEISNFLTKLKASTQVKPEDEPIKVATPWLKQVILENIGPFECLKLDLDPGWNVILGDNGVGKSVILRAIAVAICGVDATPYASRLIKAGKSNAMITLVTERNTYKTEILLNANGSANISSIPVRPLEAENWLALGFPPLRAGSWNRPQTPETNLVSVPTPEDVLPLVAGGPDPRLDKLKHWMVNLDYRSKHEKSANPAGTESKYEKILNEAFRIVGELTEGVTIERGEINPQTYEITVKTDDGDLPIEAVSQGTTSLIGWVGIVLQRLYEVYQSDDEPRKRYALVLMDEIDAHLHPTWQQALISKLSEIFPNAQILATTHSPLIVGGLSPEKVFRFARGDDGKVQRLTVDEDMLLGRTDQILTTSLFGLKTTLDTETQSIMAQYARLLGKSRRTAKEEAEFLELQRKVQRRVPPPWGSLEERRAFIAGKEALNLKVQATRRASAKRPIKKKRVIKIVPKRRVAKNKK